jgi:tetratricopeptide (TPR) repeat protein
MSPGSLRRSSAVVLLLLAAVPLAPAAAPDGASREEACRANNVGVALLEQVKFIEGAESFRKALKLDPQLAIAQINLAIALLNVPDLPGAQREAEAAARLSPDRPQPHYVAGLVAKSQNRADDALAAFAHVLQMDPDDVGANVNLAQLRLQQQKYDEAIALLRRAIEAEPYNSTAAYSLATALLRSGQREEGQVQMGRFQKLREAGYATSLTQNYPMQGRYAEALVSTGRERTLADPRPPAVMFKDATVTARLAPAARPDAKAAAAAPSATLADLDGDGDLDVAAAEAGRVRVLLNDAGTFTDITSAAGALADAAAAVIVAGDYDNDGRVDLFVVREGGFALFHNEGGGKFSDVSEAAGMPKYPHAARSAAFVDIDHDGDLDVFVAPSPGPSDAAVPSVLLRNDGQGKFVEAAAESRLGSARSAVGIVPTDYDNHRDVDLLVAREAEAPLLFKNLRDGTFREVSAEAGLNTSGHVSCVAAGDLNKDTYTDFVLGRADGVALLALSDGRSRFAFTPAPDVTAGALAALVLDYDNDGLLDVAVATPKGLRLVRAVGETWSDASASALAPELLAPKSDSDRARGLAAGDLDGDGDTDLVLLTAAGLRLARNEGAERNGALRVALSGRGSNRSGVGAKVETRAGSLLGRLELYATTPAAAPADLVFGVGSRPAVDAIRILWPSGTLQAETDLPPVAVDPKAPRRAVRTVEELDRTPSSCPYLFTWNGATFAFVTDFMGGGEMGSWLAPGVRNRPDPEEYVRIRPDQLKPRDGRYDLRITHELEEVLYVDRLELLAVAHPADADVHPNEGLTDPPRPFQLHAARGAQPPVAAVDEHGHDVLDRVRALDGRAVDDFETLHVRGYAAEHALTLDLGTAGRPARLFLTGWTEYAFSSDNVAAFQAGIGAQVPALQARDASGRWQTIVPDIGFPVGRPQTIVVDLAGRLPAGAREVRIVTNLRVFWDQVLVDQVSSDVPTRVERLDAAAADLRARGFSTATRWAGRTALDFDYTRASATFPWKQMPGRYTREGDVVPLLAATDDRFVICHPGDEIALSFDATALAPLPSGWTRTFLLRVDGFSKEMNLHSASPDVVAPLPFHGMTEYPYAPEQAPARGESYFAEYVDRYNTRVVARPMPRLEAIARGR